MVAQWWGLEARDWLAWIEEDDAVPPAHFPCKITKIFVDRSILPNFDLHESSEYTAHSLSSSTKTQLKNDVTKTKTVLQHHYFSTHKCKSHQINKFIVEKQIKISTTLATSYLSLDECMYDYLQYQDTTIQ